MVFGTFDFLHEGHIYLLQEAKRHVDFLIVVLARDETVKKVKNFYPTNNEKQRLKEIQNLGFVDKVVLGEIENKYKVIEKYRPDIIALGYDQFVFTYKIPKILIDFKLNTEIIRIDSFKPDIFKSSIIKAKLNENV